MDQVWSETTEKVSGFSDTGDGERTRTGESGALSSLGEKGDCSSSDARSSGGAGRGNAEESGTGATAGVTGEGSSSVTKGREVRMIGHFNRGSRDVALGQFDFAAFGSSRTWIGSRCHHTNVQNMTELKKHFRNEHITYERGG